MPRHRRSILPGLAALASIAAGVGCYQHTPFASLSRFVSSRFCNLPEHHAITSGGSPTTSTSRVLASAGFRTIVTLGLIADDAKTAGSFQLQEGYIPVLVFCSPGGLLAKPAVVAAAVAPGKNGGPAKEGAAFPAGPTEVRNVLRFAEVSVLAVRASPDRRARRVAVLPRGSALRVTGPVGDWLRVSGPFEGFVRADEVAEIPAQAVPPARRLYVAAERALVREGPGPRHPISGTLHRGARVEVGDPVAGWWRLTDPVRGFLFPDRLSTRPAERTLAGGLPEDRYVAIDLLTVRLGPGETFPEEGRLYRGTLARVLNDENGWSLLDGPVGGYAVTAGLADEPEDAGRR